MTESAMDSCYCTNLRRGANVVTDLYNSALRKTGLTVAQYSLLANLARLRSANITHWSQQAGLERSTMVRNIRPLEQRGLVEKTEGHGKTFRLSSKGKQLMEAARGEWAKAQQELEDYLGPEDAKALLRITARLREMKNA